MLLFGLPNDSEEEILVVPSTVRLDEVSQRFVVLSLECPSDVCQVNLHQEYPYYPTSITESNTQNYFICYFISAKYFSFTLRCDLKLIPSSLGITGFCSNYFSDRNDTGQVIFILQSMLKS